MQNNWQPIETAPKDGTDILVFAPGMIFVAAWDDPLWKSKACIDEYFGTDRATHWMPLPDKPSASRPCSKARACERPLEILVMQHSDDNPQSFDEWLRWILKKAKEHQKNENPS